MINNSTITITENLELKKLNGKLDLMKLPETSAEAFVHFPSLVSVTHCSVGHVLSLLGSDALPIIPWGCSARDTLGGCIMRPRPLPVPAANGGHLEY